MIQRNLWFLLLIALWLAVFYRPLSNLLVLSCANPQYSHIVLIPFVTQNRKTGPRIS